MIVQGFKIKKYRAIELSLPIFLLKNEGCHK